MKRVIVDIDSICADILTPWLAIYNAKKGLNLTVDDVKSWDMHKMPGAALDVYDVLGIEGFFRGLEPLPGAIPSVAMLNATHEVLLVTAAETPISFKEKAEWVRQHMPFLTKRQLVLMHEKQLIPADYFVDDNPKTAAAYRAAHPDAKILTIAYPYNIESQAYNLHALDWTDPRRAWSWIYAYINLVEGECFTLPDGSCAAPNPCICTPDGCQLTAPDGDTCRMPLPCYEDHR